MKPLKFLHIVEETAERCNQPRHIAEAVLRLYFKELRTTLSSLQYPAVQVLNLGSFSLKPGTLKRKLLRKQDMLLQRPVVETKRSLALQQEMKEEIDTIERVLKLLEDEKERKRLFAINKAYDHGNAEQFDSIMEKERKDF